MAIRLLKDGADTFYVVSEAYTGEVTLNLTYEASSGYFGGRIDPGVHPKHYAPGEAPPVPEAVRQRAPLVLSRAGLEGGEDLATTVTRLAAYFRGFGEEPIPQEDEVGNLYEALALGGNGCCRHRAYAFVATLHALGYPARVVVNEAHAFAEVKLPRSVDAWRQVNLGGCGTYDVHNPRGVDAYAGVGAGADAPAPQPSGDDAAAVERVVRTDITLGDTPARVEKAGEDFGVAGTATLEDDGRRTPLQDAPVDVYLNRSGAARGVLVATGHTGGLGDFRLIGHLAPTLAPGAYDLVAHMKSFQKGTTLYAESWDAAPTILWSATRLNLTVPETEGVGVPVPVMGRLLDAAGYGVPSANVTLLVDGGPEGHLVTDARGVFSAEVAFDALGRHEIAADYAGDDHHGPASALEPVEVVASTILVDAEPDGARGTSWAFDGKVLAGARGVPDVDVAVQAAWMPAPVTLRTDAEGRFSSALPIPRDARLETAQVTFLADPPGARRTLDLQVVRPTVLDVTAPTTVEADGFAAFRVQLTTDGDEGAEPLPNARVFLGLGHRAHPLRAVTDATGAATFTLPAEDLPASDGEVKWRLTYPGTDELAAAEATGTLHVAVPGASVALWIAWAGGLGGPLLVGAAAYAWHRHGGRIPAPAWARRPTYTLALESPGVTGSLPPVWAPGEPAKLRVRGLRILDGVAEPAAGLRVRATLPTGTHRLRLDDRGVAEIGLDGLPEGTHRVDLRAGRQRTRDELHVTPYARDMERAWAAAHDAARRAGVPVSPGTTPRELAAALAAAGGDAEAAERAAELYEAAEYAPGDVDRAGYEAFLRALAAAGGAPDG